MCGREEGSPFSGPQSKSSGPLSPWAGLGSPSSWAAEAPSSLPWVWASIGLRFGGSQDTTKKAARAGLLAGPLSSQCSSKCVARAVCAVVSGQPWAQDPPRAPLTLNKATLLTMVPRPCTAWTSLQSSFPSLSPPPWAASPRAFALAALFAFAWNTLPQISAEPLLHHSQVLPKCHLLQKALLGSTKASLPYIPLLYFSFLKKKKVVELIGGDNG